MLLSLICKLTEMPKLPESKPLKRPKKLPKKPRNNKDWLQKLLLKQRLIRMLQLKQPKKLEKLLNQMQLQKLKSKKLQGYKN